jgi:hypothetical protein
MSWLSSIVIGLDLQNEKKYISDGLAQLKWKINIIKD